MFFRFKRRTTQSLDYVERLLVAGRHEQTLQSKTLRIILSNQELFDAYAAQIAEQNSQIRNAVAVISSEIAKLQVQAQAIVDVPLDTSQMDVALAQLAGAVDSVEALPTPVAVVDVPVEVPVEDPIVVPVEVLPDAPSDGGGFFR